MGYKDILRKNKKYLVLTSYFNLSFIIGQRKSKSIVSLFEILCYKYSIRSKKVKNKF
jgi:hypothetical protein